MVLEIELRYFNRVATNLIGIITKNIAYFGKKVAYINIFPFLQIIDVDFTLLNIS
ncbi:hypothetical protein GCM10011500_53560 [Mucilaginibacter rubeus]|nr:hypothetical protein GCM10011500_53560 [Mucilaginibacter rubeus]